MKNLLEESSRLLNVKLEVLIDSTGLREDDSSFYYANRTGNKKKNSAKMTVVDVNHR